MSSQNKSIVHNWVEEVINKQQFDQIETYFAPDYVNHMIPPGQPQGPAGERQLTLMFLSAFPDGRMSIEDDLAEGDLVAGRGTFSGTHQGDFMGIPATGKAINIPIINVLRLADGKIVENWSALDMMGMMQQLGVIPSPESN